MLWWNYVTFKFFNDKIEITNQMKRRLKLWHVHIMITEALTGSTMNAFASLHISRFLKLLTKQPVAVILTNAVITKRKKVFGNAWIPIGRQWCSISMICPFLIHREEILSAGKICALTERRLPKETSRKVCCGKYTRCYYFKAKEGKCWQQ